MLLNASTSSLKQPNSISASVNLHFTTEFAVTQMHVVIHTESNNVSFRNQILCIAQEYGVFSLFVVHKAECQAEATPS